MAASRECLTHKYFEDSGLFACKNVLPGMLTHLLLEGGCVKVTNMNEFRRTWADDMRAGTCKISITENRTTIFPMYVDADLKGALFPTLENDAIVKMTQILNEQIMRFFVDRVGPFECVVCTKGDTASLLAVSYTHLTLPTTTSV